MSRRGPEHRVWNGPRGCLVPGTLGPGSYLTPARPPRVRPRGSWPVDRSNVDGPAEGGSPCWIPARRTHFRDASVTVQTCPRPGTYLTPAWPVPGPGARVRRVERR